MLGHGVVQRQAALICVSMKLYSGFSRGSLRLKRGQMLLVILIVLSFFVHCLAWSYGYGSQMYKTSEPQTGPAKTKFMTKSYVFLGNFWSCKFQLCGCGRWSSFWKTGQSEEQAEQAGNVSIKNLNGTESQRTP